VADNWCLLNEFVPNNSQRYSKLDETRSCDKDNDGEKASCDEAKVADEGMPMTEWQWQAKRNSDARASTGTTPSMDTGFCV
jgi:hypothetical protein